MEPVSSSSSSPAVLRVRRLKNSPASSLLVLQACRKRKAEASEEAEAGGLASIKILKLAATLPAGDCRAEAKEISQIIQRKETPGHSMKELKERYKQSLGDKVSSEQAKVDLTEKRCDKRFKLVSVKREIKLNDLEDWPDTVDQSPQTEKTDNNLFHMYDLVSEDTEKDSVKKVQTIDVNQEKVSCNGVEMIREYVGNKVDPSDGENPYVYDIYYAGDDPEDLTDFDDSLLDGLVSIQPFNSGSDLWYDTTLPEFKYDDDVDSNDEDNEANEYPDEDDDDDDGSYCGYGEDDFDLDMRVKGLAIDDSDDERDELSSDEEDQLLYTKSFKSDSVHHGSAYARFKQKMMKEFYQSKEDEDSEDDDCELFVDDDL